MVTTVGRALDDPARLRALRAARLAAAAEAASLDRLTAMAAHLADAPMSALSLIDTDRQLVLSGAGVPDDWAAGTEFTSSWPAACTSAAAAPDGR